MGGEEEDDKKMKRIEDIYSSSPQKKKQKVEEESADSHEGADKLLIGNMGKDMKKNAIKKKREKKVCGERKSTFGVVPPVFREDKISYIQLHDVAEKRPSLLLKKKLDVDDVDRSLNRLLIGRCMTPLVTNLLGEINKDDFVRFITRDVSGADNELRLMRSSTNSDEDDEYVLGHKWNDVAHILDLHQGDTIEGWGFPLQHEFRMTILVLRKP